LIRRDADAALKHLLGNADDTLDDETHEARACFDAGDYGGALDRWPPRDRDARSILQALIQGKPPHIALRRLSRRMRVFYVSAFQSRLFNQVLTQRLEADTLDRLETGDLAWLHDRGAVFLVDDPDVEQPRADRFEISPSGPIWGHKVRIAREEPGRREYAVLAAEHLTPRDFRSRDATRAPGARRPLRVPIGDWQVETDEDGLLLRFALPSGSYATMLLREVMKA
jgi:tRNA pseudouridine13 synthase